MRYKVGDRVVIRSDIVESERYYSDDGEESNSVTESMAEMAGQVMTIKRIYDGQYILEEDEWGWRWVDGMFEGYAKEEQEPDYDDILLEDFLKNL